MKTLKWIKIVCGLRSLPQDTCGHLLETNETSDFIKARTFRTGCETTHFSKTKPLTGLLCANHSYNNMCIIISGVNTTFEEKDVVFYRCRTF